MYVSLRCILFLVLIVFCSCLDVNVSIKVPVNPANEDTPLITAESFVAALPATFSVLAVAEGVKVTTQLSVCPAGYYCVTRDAVPVPCPLGTYYPLQGAQNESQCEICPPGRVCGFGTAIPLNCTAGTFRNASGGESLETDCEECYVGSYCVSGSVTPVACVSGTVRATPGGLGPESCSPCPTGSWCGENTSVPTLCAAGTFRNDTGGATSDSCSTCIAGSYCVEGVSVPTPCPSRTYSPSTGASFCLPCPEGSVCAVGTITPVPCDAGTYRNITSGEIQEDCTACIIGHYCESGSVHPSACDMGTYQTSTGMSVCDICSAGEYQSETGLNFCNTCGAGTYSTGTGMTDSSDCVSCYTGSYQTGHGMTSFSDCTPCASNHYCPTPTTFFDCPVFSHSPNGTGSITSCVCDLGYEGPNGGPCTICNTSVWCKSGTPNNCPENSLVNFPGGSSLSDCMCVPGFFGYAMNTMGVPCAVCQANSYCEGGVANLTVDCPYGEYSPPGTDSISACYCPANASSGPGATNFDMCTCNPRFKRVNNETFYPTGWECVPCGANEVCFNDTSIICPPNSYSAVSVPSYDQCVCNPGYFNGNGSDYDHLCTQCDANYYCTGDSTQKQCNYQMVAPPQSVNISACYCIDGYVGKGNDTCSPCPSNHYCTLGDAFQCPSFSTSQVQSSTLSQCQCLPGYWGPNGGSCRACLPGTSKTFTGCINCSNQVATDCATCQLGSYANISANGAPCSLCPPGTYLDSTGNLALSACKPCAKGTYQTGHGLTAASDCQYCGTGTYGTGTAMISASNCSACQAGQYQTGVGVGQRGPVVPGQLLGAVAYYPFESSNFLSNALSSSPLIPRGTGATYTDDAPGSQKGSAFFNGFGSLQSVTVSIGALRQTLSLSFWVKVSAATTGTILTLVPSDATSGIRFWKSGNVFNWRNSETSVTFLSDAWTHIAVVISADTSSLFVNGGSPQSFYCDWINRNIVITFGDNAPAYNDKFVGQLAQIVVYQTELLPGLVKSLATALYYSGTCLFCPAGSYSFTGASFCTQCGAGTFSAIVAATTSNVCTTCPYASYAAESGASTCTLCPMFSNTTGKGSAFSSQCLCKPGYYGNCSSISTAPNGLLAYYRFQTSNMMGDSSGNGNILNLRNYPPSNSYYVGESPIGLVSYGSLGLDSTYNAIPTQTLVSRTGDLSLCLWMKHSNPGWYQVAFWLGTMGYPFTLSWQPSVWIWSIYGQYGFLPSIPSGKWFHVCFVFSSNKVFSLYLNGVLYAQVSTYYLFSDFQFYFGNNGGGTPPPCQYAEVMIFDNALTAAQVSSIYSRNYSCIDCTANSFCEGNAVNVKSSCPNSLYSFPNASSVNQCICPTDSTWILGSNCTCNPSFYKVAAINSLGGWQCSPCQVGYYCYNGIATACPLNSSSLASSFNVGNCTGCLPGFLKITDGNCTACSSGSYCPNMTTQITCPAGSYCPFLATGPIQCGAGYYSLAGATSCMICPTNQQSTAGSAGCVCNPGYYGPAYYNAVMRTGGFSVSQYTSDNVSYSVTSFLSSGTITFNAPTLVDVLIVGGGGGGGWNAGGGGGGGGVIYQASVIVPAGTYQVTVGKGGVGSNYSIYSSNQGNLTNGGLSSIFGGTAYGGGGGACFINRNLPGNSGGSGGGGAPSAGLGGMAFPAIVTGTILTSPLVTGFAGAAASTTVGGGGGGAYSLGQTSDGGIGFNINIYNGTQMYFAGGGGGGTTSTGTRAGVAGTGGGGGGGGYSNIPGGLGGLSGINLGKSGTAGYGGSAGANTGSGGGGTCQDLAVSV